MMMVMVVDGDLMLMVMYQGVVTVAVYRRGLGCMIILIGMAPDQVTVMVMVIVSSDGPDDGQGNGDGDVYGNQDDVCSDGDGVGEGPGDAPTRW